MSISEGLDVRYIDVVIMSNKADGKKESNKLDKTGNIKQKCAVREKQSKI